MPARVERRLFCRGVSVDQKEDEKVLIRYVLLYGSAKRGEIQKLHILGRYMSHTLLHIVSICSLVAASTDRSRALLASAKTP